MAISGRPCKPWGLSGVDAPAAKSAADQMREDFARRGGAFKTYNEKHSGLDRDLRKMAMGSTMKHEGHATINLKLAGFPRGTKSDVKASGIFKEVRLDRGRAVPFGEA